MKDFPLQNTGRSIQKKSTAINQVPGDNALNYERCIKEERFIVFYLIEPERQAR